MYPGPSVPGVLSGAPQGQVLILKEVTPSYSKKARRTALVGENVLHYLLIY